MRGGGSAVGRQQRDERGRYNQPDKRRKRGVMRGGGAGRQEAVM
jgi:hypothetical protein